MIEKTIPNTIPARGGLRSSGLRLAAAILAAAPATMLAPVANAAPITFVPGNLAVLYSVYPGLPDPNTGSTGGYTTPNITPGVTQLPINPPVTAIAGGSYPNVFNNAQVDGNFGVTSPIYLGQITPTGKTVSTTDLTALTGITTSFPSKSETALNLSTNRNALTFLGYNSGVSGCPRRVEFQYTQSYRSVQYRHADPDQPLGRADKSGRRRAGDQHQCL
jgi:hypothetical protein